MAASEKMPYFIQPSINLSAEEKKVVLRITCDNIMACLAGEKDLVLKMATINCLIKTHLPYAYWVGFYLYKNGQLSIGPYQGTMGCLHIEMGRGVCGKVAQDGRTIIVDDVHSLEQGKTHIACDPNSKSEIVLPVFDKDKKLIGVLDIDSTLLQSFDQLDQLYFEKMLLNIFGK